MKIKIHVVGWLFVSLAIISCSKDVIEEPISAVGVSDLVLNKSEDAPLELSYDLVTAAFAAPNDPADNDQLTKAEVILGTPILTSCRVHKFINSDGTIDADIEILQLPGVPTYPENTIGRNEFPEEMVTKRIEIRKGKSTYFNYKGEPIRYTQQDAASITEYENTLELIGEAVQLKPEYLDYIFEGFVEAGFTVVDNPTDPNLKEIHHTTPSGALTKILVDKEVQKITARLNYDEDGELETISHVLYDEKEGENVVSGHRFVAFYESPFSGIKMAINRVSQVQNLQIIQKDKK